MVMLFFAFLDIEFKPQIVSKKCDLGFACKCSAWHSSVMRCLLSFDLTLALAAFMTAIAPTAIAAPVIIGFIKGKLNMLSPPCC